MSVEFRFVCFKYFIAVQLVINKLNNILIHIDKFNYSNVLKLYYVFYYYIMFKKIFSQQKYVRLNLIFLHILLKHFII